jgi:regulator of protease activity HflC (stomatin/prohibitin superfamily)
MKKLMAAFLLSFFLVSMAGSIVSVALAADQPSTASVNTQEKAEKDDSVLSGNDIVFITLVCVGALVLVWFISCNTIMEEGNAGIKRFLGKAQVPHCDEGWRFVFRPFIKLDIVSLKRESFDIIDSQFETTYKPTVQITTPTTAVQFQPDDISIVSMLIKEISVTWQYNLKPKWATTTALQRKALQNFFRYDVETIKENIRDFVQNNLRKMTVGKGVYPLMQATGQLQDDSLTDLNTKIKEDGLPVEIVSLVINDPPTLKDPKQAEAIRLKADIDMRMDADLKEIERQEGIAKGEVKVNKQVAKAYDFSDEQKPAGLMELRRFKTLDNMATGPNNTIVVDIGTNIPSALPQLGKALKPSKSS